MMVFKLTQQAQGKWRRINAPHLVNDVANGVTFVNGECLNPPENMPSSELKEDMTKEKIAV
jgi:hypothetical protein